MNVEIEEILFSIHNSAFKICHYETNAPNPTCNHHHINSIYYIARPAGFAYGTIPSAY